MRLLLDTHAWLWFVLGDARLTSTARAAIQNPSNEKCVSPANCWEIAIKISLGKYSVPQPYERFLEHALAGQGFQILPITPAHTIAVVDLPFHHRDPFDRLLIAQSIVEGVQIVSADDAFDAYLIQRLW